MCLCLILLLVLILGLIAFVGETVALLNSSPNHRPPALTLRSISLGLLGGILICCLAPYNDFVVNNTYLIGNSLPVVVVMILFGLAVLVNGPLATGPLLKARNAAGEMMQRSLFGPALVA